jgi:hypothetical protein
LSSIVIYGLAGRLSEFEFDRPSGFLLADACPFGCVTAWCDLIDFQGDHVAAAKLAIDGQVERSKVASATFDLESLESGQLSDHCGPDIKRNFRRRVAF